MGEGPSRYGEDQGYGGRRPGSKGKGLSLHVKERGRRQGRKSPLKKREEYRDLRTFDLGGGR